MPLSSSEQGSSTETAILVCATCVFHVHVIVARAAASVVRVTLSVLRAAACVRTPVRSSAVFAAS